MTHPHTHKEEFPDTQRLSEKANKDKREAEGYLPQKTSKEEPRSWEERFENIYRPLYLATEASVAEHFHDTIKDLLSTREKEVTKNVSMLRQWLNEDRIDDPKKMVTNEDIMTWLTTNS